MNKQQVIKFKCTQIYDLLDVLEKFGIDPDISDAHASAMFSELIVTALQNIDREQSDNLFDSI